MLVYSDKRRIMNVSMRDNQHNELPYYLWPETVGTMPIQTPRYVEPRSIYVDAKNRAAMYRFERFTPHSRQASLKRGQIAVMMALSELECDSGIVADFRYMMDEENEPPVNQQNFELWDEELEDMIPVVASVSTDPETGLPSITGDPRFCGEARYLASLVDEDRSQLMPRAEQAQPIAFTLRDKLAVKALQVRYKLGLPPC